MSKYKELNFKQPSYSAKTTNTFPKLKEMFKEVYNKRKIKDSVEKKPRKIQY